MQRSRRTGGAGVGASLGARACRLLRTPSTRPTCTMASQDKALACRPPTLDPPTLDPPTLNPPTLETRAYPVACPLHMSSPGLGRDTPKPLTPPLPRPWTNPGKSKVVPSLPLPLQPCPTTASAAAAAALRLAHVNGLRVVLTRQRLLPPFRPLVHAWSADATRAISAVTRASEFAETCPDLHYSICRCGIRIP